MTRCPRPMRYSAGIALFIFHILDASAVLTSLKRTGATYIFLNTYPHAVANKDQFTGAKWRWLDMTRPPFNFSDPIKSFRDGGDVDPNIMGLWKLQELPNMDY